MEGDTLPAIFSPPALRKYPDTELIVWPESAMPIKFSKDNANIDANNFRYVRGIIKI